VSCIICDCWWQSKILLFIVIKDGPSLNAWLVCRRRVPPGELARGVWVRPGDLDTVSVSVELVFFKQPL